MIRQTLKRLLEGRKFINVATCDFEGRPNAAPKFLLAVEGNIIYLVDYVIKRTYENLKINPQISVPIVNSETLVGYQINGSVHIVEEGGEFNRLRRQLEHKVIQSSVERVVDGVHHEKIHKNFEVIFPEQIVIFKIIVSEIVEIGPTGRLTRDKSEEA